MTLGTHPIWELERETNKREVRISKQNKQIIIKYQMLLSRGFPPGGEGANIPVSGHGKKVFHCCQQWCSGVSGVPDVPGLANIFNKTRQTHNLNLCFQQFLWLLLFGF